MSYVRNDRMRIYQELSCILLNIMLLKEKMSTNSSLNQQKRDQEHHNRQQIPICRSNQVRDDSQNAGQSLSSENLGRPNNEFPIRLEFAARFGPSNYYQSLSKILLYIYNKLQEENEPINIQSKNQYQSTFISQLAQFIDQNKKLFLYSLQLLTKQSFPKIQYLLKMNDDFFKNNLMTEMPTKTLGSALRQIRLKEDPKQQKQHNITLSQDLIKCLFIGSLLLCGCGPISLDQNSQNNEKTDKKFQRIVLALLRKTSMLTKKIFQYIQEHWQSILHLILFQKIQTMTEDEDQTQMREEFLSEKSQPMEKKKSQAQTKQLTLQKEKSNLMDQEDEIYQYQYINFSSFHNESSFLVYEIPDADQQQLNELFSDQFQFKSSSSSNSSKSINNEQKYQIRMNLKNRAQKKESQQTAKKSREKMLIQRARKLFKYGQKRRQRKPTKKQLQKKKQRKDIKVKKPHPRHQKRQIDILIQFIIKDQFCIAYAIANHISNALDAQKMKLSVSN